MTADEIASAAVFYSFVGMMIGCWFLYQIGVGLWTSGHHGVIFGAGAVVVALAGYYFYDEHKKAIHLRFAKQELDRKISEVKVSTDRHDYVVEAADYRRGNPKENLYRRAFHLQLLQKFNNCCAKCGRSDNGIDIDHFFLSKNEGGNFILRHRDGYLVNNALPLCISCNRSKSDVHYAVFFAPEELLRLFERNAELTFALNSQPLFDATGAVIKKKRA